jgi:hypothetical protein
MSVETPRFGGVFLGAPMTGCGRKRSLNLRLITWFKRPLHLESGH